MELKIRMSDELYLLILRTAEYVRIKPAEVLQAAIRGYVTNRPVAHYAIRETCYKSGNIVMTVRKITNRVKVDDGLRLYIARRCEEELWKKRPIHRSYAAEAGISYRVPATLEEAMQMACYVEE
ncbi:hypothetical protein [Victivallis vadensis]|uniref:hypothetical protein n=1 Tax=Victivallis vadensis TaxID=172901 RepID=UPI00307EB72C